MSARSEQGSGWRWQSANHFADATDATYVAEVNEAGGRAALWVLRQKALQGDVRALDIYLKHYYEWQRSKAKPTTTDGSVIAAGYQEKRAETTTVVEANDHSSTTAVVVVGEGEPAGA